MVPGGSRVSGSPALVWSLAYVSLTVGGFALGWYGGGNDGGAGAAEAAVRNLWYGLVFGAAQAAAVALVPAWRSRALLVAWPVATAVGFAVGVQIWKRAMPRGGDPQPDGRLLGLVLAVVLVGLQAALLWWGGLLRSPREALWWWSWGAAGWIVLEALAVWWGYGGWRIVAVVAPGAALWAIGFLGSRWAGPGSGLSPRPVRPGRGGTGSDTTSTSAPPRRPG